MTDINIKDLLLEDGPVALIIKQSLEPVDSEDPVIFPPTYPIPITSWNGRVHTIRDGDYRVTVELPSGSKNDKDKKKENQKPGYQIDHFPDGTNICEIDSPQSQSNRIEPKFKEIEEGKLVPQVEIQVGKAKVNLLDVGHRAGDAVVRMSSLADEIHDAFTAVKSHDFFKLATIAPTSLVFGVWDSRSTYVKQQRLFKSYIRATNIREISRSAQFAPAVAYVDSGAINQDVEKKTGDESNLSQEGMVHALSTQSVGGVMLTDTSKLIRTVNVNIGAIRALRGIVPPEQAIKSNNGESTQFDESIDCTTELQYYILGLALVAALHEPDLNLREGCHLKYKDDEKPPIKLIYRARPGIDASFTYNEVLTFAKEAKTEFFRLARINEEGIDRRDAVFETGIAEKFLSYSKGDRDTIRKLGPITQETLNKFQAKKQAVDPKEKLSKLVDAVQMNKAGKKLNLGPVKKLRQFLESIDEGDDLKKIADQMIGVLEEDIDPNEQIEKLKSFLPNVDSESEEKDTSTDEDQEGSG